MSRHIIKFLLVSIVFIFSNSSFAEPTVISWGDLSPTNGQEAKINLNKNTEIIGVPNISEFNGSKEELDNFLDNMKSMKEMQGKSGLINMDLNNKEIKIAGYIAPIAFDGDNVTEFLLVPYHGACIHVPPPPANQIIYVKSATGLKAEGIQFPKWVTGTLQAVSLSTVVADVGYSIEEATVSPYKPFFGLF
jgi:hypothetical protein|tara:strand:- start:16 stop:588 length:573 start_codon:yes stop_codon:yes gene_type:complete